EKSQRLIHDEDPHQRCDAARDVNGNVRDQSGRPNARVGCYRYAHDPQSASTRLNECLKRVGIVREYKRAHRRVAVIGPKAAGCVRDLDAGQYADNRASNLLQYLLQLGELLDGENLAISDHDIRTPFQDWTNELPNVCADILVVGIGVHNDVRASA